MQLNTHKEGLKTHEGARAKHINETQQLRRSVMACMLWEKGFYEEGEDISERIAGLIPKVSPHMVSSIAIEARERMKLRHVPLLIVREMARIESHKGLVAKTLERVIQRPDEITEFLAIYWKDGRQPLSAQVKKGLAKAFGKFSEYQLAKYDRPKSIKLKDALFLSHAKPKNTEQEATWKGLIDGTLKTPDTWEVALSSGANKEEAWNRLISENKLGGLAVLRNLRNMCDVGVDDAMIRKAISQIKTDRILPYRFIAAASYGTRFEPELEGKMFSAISGQKILPGTTLLLVDVSGSMIWTVSKKTEMTMLDAACGLAILLREVCQHIRVATFSSHFVEVPTRRGFALRDSITISQTHGGTDLGGAIRIASDKMADVDRIIVLTDEQSRTEVPDPIWKRAYIVNVSNAQNGVGYGPWVHVDGWSEAIVDYITEFEQENG